MMRTVLYSVKPEFANLILSGQKTVELRKRAPMLEPNDRVLLYASSPQKQLVGLIEVTEIITDQIDLLWARVEERACIDLDRFQDYFRGKELGFGLCLGRVQAFQKPISLDDLRAQWQGFNPPQDYRYVTLEMKSSRVIQRNVNQIAMVNLGQCDHNDFLIRI
jgi:predicted transcriptional regulator